MSKLNSLCKSFVLEIGKKWETVSVIERKEGLLAVQYLFLPKLI